MVDKEDIIALIYEVLDETNGMLPTEQQVEKSLETALYGPKSPVDSLGLITLIVGIEQKVDEKFGATIILAEDGKMFQPDSPLSRVDFLAEHITMLLER